MTTKTIQDYTEKKTNEIISYFPRKTIEVYFDGLCQPYNPGGTACYSFIIKNDKDTIDSLENSIIYNLNGYPGCKTKRLIDYLIMHT
jgi:hypothetical protein